MSNNDSTHAAVSNQVIHGDCVQVLQSLPGENIDFVLTDPPYLVGYRPFKNNAGQIVHNDDNDRWLRPAFAEMYRVLKPNSFSVTFYGYCKLDAFVHAWTEAGFDTVGHMVWAKPYASSARFVRVMHESAYILAKGRPNRPEAPLADVQPWEYTGNVAHPTEKAVSILRPLVESFCPAGGVVLDPPVRGIGQHVGRRCAFRPPLCWYRAGGQILPAREETACRCGSLHAAGRMNTLARASGPQGRRRQRRVFAPGGRLMLIYH